MKKSRRDRYPSRVRVLVVGGGIHGVGVLHDLVSRGWHDVLLVEKGEIGSGTSRKSTKLIHGGLRYLKNPMDYSLVYEGLRERQLLMKLIPSVVQPVELLFPVFKAKGMPKWMVRTGLYLYDFLSRQKKIAGHKKISFNEARAKIPGLKTEAMAGIYSFWDGQTDDLLLTRTVAHSAIKLGGQIQEGAEVLKIFKNEDGWSVKIKTKEGTEHEVSCRYLVNATGPWSNKLFEKSGIKPVFDAVNVKGSHLILPNLGLQAGIFLQAKSDQREMFLLPWKGKTLLGTTELLYEKNLDEMTPTDEEVSYMLDTANLYLSKKFTNQEIENQFSGLRWLAVDSNKSLHATSRKHKISEHHTQRGVAYAIYGGKLTAYRSLAAEVGDRILKDFGDKMPSRTDSKENWFLTGEKLETEVDFSTRF